VGVPRSRAALALGLALLVLVAYEGVRHCGFVAFDDDQFIYRNPHVRQGLTWAGLRWAFGADLLFHSPYADGWMPITVLSRMVDVELYGLNPAGHHLTNLLLHAANVILVFLLLDAFTAARCRSAFVAAALAVHPLTVESVAWVTERKDVLSGLLWTLTLIAYGRFVERRSPAAYATTLGVMAVGLMAKPSLMPLPFVLLALDYWPLRRLRTGWNARAAGRLLAEKVPFMLLSVAAGVVNVVAHHRRGDLATAEGVPLEPRIANAAWSLVVYLWDVVAPIRLAVFYPFLERSLWSAWTLAALAFVGLVSWLVARNAARHPYLATGWLWYLLALAPVIGIAQVGAQARADRYMYFALVGVGIIAAWGAVDVAARRPVLRPLLPWTAAAILLTWTALTRAQVRRWDSTVTLFSHAVAVTENNALAHMNLARALAKQGDAAGAERHYREAIRIRPRAADARTGLGVLLMQQGRVREALGEHEQARRLNPASADAVFNLGAAEARMGRTAEAESHYAEALRLNPSQAAAHYNWGNLLAAQGRWAEAESHFAEAARLQPENVEALNNLGLSIGLQGRWALAAQVLERAVALDPADARTHVNLGRALRALGRADQARAQWREALRLDPGGPAAVEAREELAKP
jgi:protein O-mannosyl-transferase